MRSERNRQNYPSLLRGVKHTCTYLQNRSRLRDRGDKLIQFPLWLSGFRTRLAFLRIQVQPLASLSELGSQVASSCSEVAGFTVPPGDSASRQSQRTTHSEYWFSHRNRDQNNHGFKKTEASFLLWKRHAAVRGARVACPPGWCRVPVCPGPRRFPDLQC